MAHPRAIDDESLRRLLSILRDTRLSWTTHEVPELVRVLGWTMVEMLPGKGAIAAAGWDTGRNQIHLAFTGTRVDDITMRIADAPDAGAGTAAGRPATEAFLFDTFAVAVHATADVLGPPSDRVLGADPEVSWRRENDTVRIERTFRSVNLVWANNEFQDYWDALHEEPR
jgi:hypothetical protein